MAYSYIEEVYTGDATFTIPFDYIKKEDVHLYINGIEKPFSDMTWVSDSIITVTSSLVENDVVKIARDSNVSTPVVDYQQTTVLDEVTLDLPVKQYMYLIQETRDIIDTYTSTGGTYTKSEIDALLTDLALSDNIYTKSEIDVLLASKSGLNYSYSKAESDAINITKLDSDITDVLALLNANITANELQASLLERINLIDAEGTGLVQRVQDLTGLVNTNGAAIASESITREDADSALATSITAVEARIDDKDALIASEVQARIDGDTVLAETIDTVVTMVGDLNTSVQVHSESIDGIKGKYTIKIDNNGYVSGFGLASDYNDGNPTSAFVVNADYFRIAKPGHPEVIPFSVGEIDGASVVGINGAVIIDGSIKARSLDADIVTADNVVAHSITADEITLGGITTECLAPNAVTLVRSYNNDVSQLFTSTNYETFASLLNQDTTGKPTLCMLNCSYAITTEGISNIVVGLYRDTTIIQEWAFTANGSTRCLSISYLDNLCVGEHNYYFKIKHESTTSLTLRIMYINMSLMTCKA